MTDKQDKTAFMMRSAVLGAPVAITGGPPSRLVVSVVLC